METPPEKPSKPEPTLTEMTNEARANIKKWTPWAIGLLVVFVLGSLFAPKNTTPTTPDVETVNSGNFVNQCRDAISSKLKSPTSAQFSNAWQDEPLLNDDNDGSYFWRGTVDADNSFGAKIRSKFLCEMNNGKLSNAELK